MTDVFIDDIRIDFEDPGADSTVGELMSVLDTEMKGARRFLKEISIDGERFSDRGAVSGRPVSDCVEIKIKTDSFDRFTLEILEMLNEYIKIINVNTDSCVKELRLKGSYEAVFSSIVEGLIEITKTIDALISGAGTFNIRVFEEAPEAYYEEILRVLEALKAARDSGDTVLLADILEYEVAPLLKGMEEKLLKQRSA